MLTRKAPVLIATAVLLSGLAVAFGLFGAAVLAAGLLLLFAVNALAMADPELEGRVHVAHDRATEGQRVRAQVQLSNQGRRVSIFEHRLDLADTFEPAQGERTGHRALLAGDEDTWEVTAIPRLFGIQPVGPLRVRVEDPSGLRAAEHEVTRARQLLVHPATEPLKSVSLKLQEQTSFIGMNEASQPGDGFEFYTLRKYQSGDSVRSINWRASARSKDMIVNQRQRESHMEVAILLDATAEAGKGRIVASPFARGVRAAASLLEFLLHKRDRVTFYYLTDELQRVHPSSPTRQRLAIYEAMATLRPHGSLPWTQAIEQVLPHLGAKVPVVLVSGFETDPTVVPAVRDLVAREHHVTALSASTRWPERTAPAALEVRQRHRALVRDEIRATGAAFVDLDRGQPLNMALMEAAQR